MPWVKVYLPHESPPWYQGKFDRRTGVLFISVFALISFVSVLVLLIIVASRAWKRHRLRRAGHTLEHDGPVQPISVLFILAMITELVQAFSLMLSAKWPIDGAVVEGPHCTAQASLYQFGMIGGAVFTTDIAIMTLLAVRWPTLVMAHDRKILYGMLAFAFVFLPLMTVIPGVGINSIHYGSSGAWCWIVAEKGHKVSAVSVAIMRVMAEYIWVWLASLTCFICYGYIVVRWYLQAGRSFGKARDSFVMLWYPIAYFIEIFPQTVVSFAITTAAALHGTGKAHPAFFVFSNILYASSGWINVSLWSLTGRQFGFTRESTRTVAAPDSGNSPGEASTRTNGLGEEEKDTSIPLALYMSHPYPNARLSDPFEPDMHSNPAYTGHTRGASSISSSSTQSTSPHDPSFDLRRTSGSRTGLLHSYNTHRPSENSPYNLPNFPGDQEAGEHAEYARSLPDYGGEEFWAKQAWNPNGTTR